MIRYIKRKLSVKIFLITFILLILSCIGTYFCISKLLPATYTNMIDHTTENEVAKLIDQLTAYDNLSDCEEALSSFSKATNAVFWIEDQNGNVLYPTEASTTTESIYGDEAITFDNDAAYFDINSSGKTSTSFYPITLRNGSKYTLAVQVDLFVVQQTTEVLLSIFPYVVFMLLALSLLCSWLYAKYITHPIVQLSKVSKQMASLDFSGQSSMKREDELGYLAQNLYFLSATLSTALNELNAANEQLKADIKKEQELERQRVEFFAAASHELKTPLTILKGHLDGMLNGISGYESHTEYMKRSLAVVEQMENLVKELLYISKSDGTQRYEYKTADFAELIRVQLANVTDLLEDKKQKLEVNIPDQLYCEIESAQMERAIQNILVNAIRYSPENDMIQISLSASEAFVYCEIENTGIHIPDDRCSNLFEAFYRIDTSRSRNNGGTGLGLYIVRNILEMHHAKYGIQNTERGVLFWIKMPVRQYQSSFF